MPRDVALFLNARVLTHIICCDGGWHASGLLIHLNSFSLEGLQVFQAALLSNFGLNSTLHQKSSKSWVIGPICLVNAESRLLPLFFS